MDKTFFLAQQLKALRMDIDDLFNLQFALYDQNTDEIGKILGKHKTRIEKARKAKIDRQKHPWSK